MKDFDYNYYGRQQTGFENSIDHSMFGHWRNPEYQEMCQEFEMIQRGLYEQPPELPEECFKQQFNEF